MDYIKEKYMEHYKDYEDIYKKGNKEYWHNLAIEINQYCDENAISYVNYFYHKDLVENKKSQRKKIK